MVISIGNGLKIKLQAGYNYDSNVIVFQIFVHFDTPNRFQK